MGYGRVLERLEELGLTRPSWTAETPFVCPAHDDRSPSASIREGEDGRALVVCFAGCDVRDIVEAVDLTVADLFESEEPTVTAEYVYTDADELPVIKVERYEPGLDGKKKSFKQYRREGDEWVAGVRELEVRPLYNLPAVLRADEIWLVEGEKDADRLQGLCGPQGGVAATTGLGGSNQWRPEWTESLRGKDVVMIPDRDGPGMKRLDRVRQELEGVARSFRVKVPARGKDVSDHLDCGLGLEDLIDGETRPLRLKPIDFSNIPPPRDLLFRPFIYERALTWLWGPSGHGKSVVCDAAMAELSKRGIPSLLYEWEEGYQEGERLSRLGANLSKVFVFNMMDADEPVDLGTDWFADEVTEAIRQTGARLVVFNPFILAGGLGSGDDPDQWNAPVRNARETFKQIIEETGVAVVVIDHQDDPEKERAHGGRSKKWLTDIYLRVVRDGDEYSPGNDYHIKIDNLKQAREWLPTIHATVHGGHRQGPLEVRFEYEPLPVGLALQQSSGAGEALPGQQNAVDPAPGPTSEGDAREQATAGSGEAVTSSPSDPTEGLSFKERLTFLKLQEAMNE